VQTRCLVRARGLAISLGVGLACSSAFGAAASAPASAPAARVNCAVITDPAGNLRAHPIPAFLEATLSSDPRFRLLERDQLDVLLREQQIQVMFSPDSVPQRMALGALLKVDLMIMLRVQKTTSREELQVVISETRAGYRLRVRQFAWPAGDEVKDQVLELVDQAVGKWHTPSRAVFAVPRFLRRDFVLQKEDYRDVFSLELEQTLVSYPSIVLVELSEAAGISNELGLHKAGDALVHQLPYYLNGEYETRDKEGAAEFTVKISLRQGAQTLKTYRAENMSLKDATAFINGIPRQVLRDTLLTPRLDPDLEIIDLVQQAETYGRSGDYTTASSLMSTAILLRPNDRALLTKAIRYLCWIDVMRFSCSPESRLQLSRTYRQLRMDYLERWLRTASTEAIGYFLWELPGGRSSNAGVLHISQPRPDLEGAEFSQDQRSRYKQEVEGENRRFEATVRAIYAAKAKAEGKEWLVGYEEAKRTPATRLEYIRRFQNTPEAEGALLKLLAPHISLQYSADHRLVDVRPTRQLLYAVKDPEFQRELDAVAALPGAVAQKVAKRLKAIGPQDEEQVRKDESMLRNWILRQTAFVHFRQGNSVVTLQTTRGQVPKGCSLPTNQEEQAEFSLEPLRLQIASQSNQSKNGSDSHRDENGGPRIAGWLRCGSGVDVLWSSNEIFLMREPGVLRSIYHENESCFEQYSDAIRNNAGERPLITFPFGFDGKYVWAPAFAAKDPLLDIQAGTARKIGPEQNLFPMDQGLCVAPIRPGEACVAAGFRKERGRWGEPDAAWCAIVRLDSNGQVNTELLLKADERPLPGELSMNAAQRVGAGFCPWGLHLLTDPDTSRQTLVILRQNWMASPQRTMQPLAIDLQSHEIRLVGGPIPNIRPEMAISTGDTLYIPCRDAVWKLGVPRLEVEHRELAVSSRGFEALSICSIGVFDGLSYCVSHDGWFLSRAPGEEGRLLKGSLPRELQTFGPLISTQHHGLVLMAGSSTDSVHPFTVKFSPGVLREVAEQAKREAAQRAENYRTAQKAIQQVQERGLGLVTNDEPAQSPLELLATWAPVGAIVLAIPAVLIWFLVRGRRRGRSIERVSSKEVCK
jgi:hypothetical protein